MVLPVAVLAATGGLIHLAVMPAGAHGRPTAVLFAVMALACLACAAHLLRTRSRAALVTTSVMAAVMVVAHLGYLLAVAPSFGAVAAGHHAQTPIPAPPHAGHVDLAMLLPVLPELLVLALTGPALRRTGPARRS